MSRLAIVALLSSVMGIVLHNSGVNWDNKVGDSSGIVRDCIVCHSRRWEVLY